MSLNFSCNSQMVGPECGINNMKEWIQFALDEQLKLLLSAQGRGGCYHVKISDTLSTLCHLRLEEFPF